MYFPLALERTHKKEHTKILYVPCPGNAEDNAVHTPFPEQLFIEEKPNVITQPVKQMRNCLSPDLQTQILKGKMV